MQLLCCQLLTLDAAQVQALVVLLPAAVAVLHQS
jgi:hypothetical protein